MNPSHLITHVWQAWAGVTLLWFGILEGWMLATGRPQDTLSANVWRWLQVQYGEPLRAHTALWVLIFGAYVVVVSWLGPHLFLKWWR